MAKHPPKIPEGNSLIFLIILTILFILAISMFFNNFSGFGVFARIFYFFYPFTALVASAAGIYALLTSDLLAMTVCMLSSLATACLAIVLFIALFFDIIADNAPLFGTGNFGLLVRVTLAVLGWFAVAYWAMKMRVEYGGGEVSVGSSNV